MGKMFAASRVKGGGGGGKAAYIVRDFFGLISQRK